MNDVERLLRQAQEWQVGHGPDLDRIRRALPALRARRTRRRRIGLVALAVVLVLLAAAPAVLWPRGARPDQPGGRPSLSPSPTAPASTDAGPIPFGYRPMWLPTGLHERFRAVTRTGRGELRVARAWTASKIGTGGGPPRQAVTVTVQQTHNAHDPASSAAQTVQINGITAAFTKATGRAGASVSWLADSQHIIDVTTDISLSRADLLRIARSLQTDNAELPPPLQVGWVPDGRPDVGYELSGDSGIRWNATVLFTDPNRADARITVTLAPTTVAPPDGGEVVNVGGQPAQLSTSRGADGRPLLSLVQQEANGPYLLTVSCPAATPATPTTADLIRLATQTAPSATLNTDWLD